jgi:hypothetical protein
MQFKHIYKYNMNYFKINPRQRSGSKSQMAKTGWVSYILLLGVSQGEIG